MSKDVITTLGVVPPKIPAGVVPAESWECPVCKFWNSNRETHCMYLCTNGGKLVTKP